MFVFGCIAEISARYRRQNDRTGAARLFCFHKTVKHRISRQMFPNPQPGRLKNQGSKFQNFACLAYRAQVSRGHGRPNKQNFRNFGPWFLSRHENKKDAERPYDHFAGGIAPRSLLCVRKRMFAFFFIKHALGGLHLEKNIQILIYFERLPTSCRGAELTFFILTKILIYFSRLPTSCAHLLYPSDG